MTSPAPPTSLCGRGALRGGAGRARARPVLPAVTSFPGRGGAGPELGPRPRPSPGAAWHPRPVLRARHAPSPRHPPRPCGLRVAAAAPRRGCARSPNSSTSGSLANCKSVQEAGSCGQEKWKRPRPGVSEEPSCWVNMSDAPRLSRIESMLGQLGSRPRLPGTLETIISCCERPPKMWAPIALLWLSSLSLSLPETHFSSLKESGARVFHIQKVQSKAQCSRVCRDPAWAGPHFCSLSTKEPRHCIVLYCPVLAACQEARPQDVQGLATDYALEKWSSLPTADTLLPRPEPGVFPAPPHHKTVRSAAELGQMTSPVTVTGGNHTDLGARALNSTEVGISAAPNSSMATMGVPSARLMPQVPRITGKPSMVVTAALAPSVRADPDPLPVTHVQTNGHVVWQNTPGEATGASASSPTIQVLLTSSGIAATSSSLTPTKGGSVDGPSNPEISTTTPSPAPFSSRTSTEAFMSTPTISSSTRVGSPPKPEPMPDPKVTPTTVAQATETPGTSQTTVRALPQTTLSPVSPRVTSESSPTMPQTSVQTVTENQYVWIATSPFTQSLVNKNLLLAMLLAGTMFFIAVLALLAMQAYESYKKKDYTQVDYLINGMYADSEM
ncbi:LOW QUALITY PROTEIN: uncharacterized protein C11orf24 homolog [Petaurus breviceps papuanus]|uniref:LOW QUALITY PROTEIN: uncharacterized protein C11orf24 homolog n=1 Tax=Petaurus breviceps papuanus TaxID=3040969 RepID=UPI0036DC6457